MRMRRRIVLPRCARRSLIPAASFFLQCSGDPRDLHSFPTRRSSDLLESMPHLLIGVGRRVDRTVTPRVLHDQKAAVEINAEVVTAPTGADAERQPVVELVASKERLAQFREITLTAELDTKLLSDLARTSITPHEVRRPNVFRRAVSSPYEGGHSGNVLLKVQKLRTISDGNAWDPLCPRLEERFQSVLRDELVGLKWPGTVT